MPPIASIGSIRVPAGGDENWPFPGPNGEVGEGPSPVKPTMPGLASRGARSTTSQFPAASQQGLGPRPISAAGSVETTRASSEFRHDDGLTSEASSRSTSNSAELSQGKGPVPASRSDSIPLTPKHVSKAVRFAPLPSGKESASHRLEIDARAPQGSEYKARLDESATHYRHEVSRKAAKVLGMNENSLSPQHGNMGAPVGTASQSSSKPPASPERTLKKRWDSFRNLFR